MVREEKNYFFSAIMNILTDGVLFGAGLNYGTIFQIFSILCFWAGIAWLKDLRKEEKAEDNKAK